MPFPLSFSLLLASAGVVLLAWESTKGARRNPVLALAGLLLVGGAVGSRLLSGGGVAAMLSGTFTDFGIAFLLGAMVLFRRSGSARPFVIIGAGALILGSLGKMVNRRGAETASAPQVATTLLVELGEDDDIAEIEGILHRFGATFEKAFPSVGRAEDADLSQVYLIEFLPGGPGGSLDDLLAALRADEENVDFVEMNRAVLLEPPVETDGEEQKNVIPAGKARANDPLADAQWALQAANIHQAHELLSGARPVRKAVVAILDTGVDAQHEDMRPTFLSSPASDDAHGHGTHCAGIAGAATNNGVGMASLNWEGRFVDVTAYRALSSSGMGSVESIAQAIIDATTDGADVISMSLGDYSPRPPRVIREAVEFALQRQVIVVAASGNSNQDAAGHMPANIEGVIAVSAVDASLRKAQFSNTNGTLKMPIAAPGVDILSLVPGGGYDKKSGTSMATPLVAGLLGVMRSLEPTLTAQSAYDILVESGQEVPDSRRVGRVIDAAGAVARVLRPL